MLFYLINGVIRIDNRELHLIDVIRVFERIFSVKLGEIYKKEEAVIKRKPQKLTEFLDRLKATIIQKSIRYPILCTGLFRPIVYRQSFPDCVNLARYACLLSAFRTLPCLSGNVHH